MANIYKGTTAEVEVSIVAKDGKVHLADDSTQFSAEFYIRGTHGKPDATVVTVQKNEVFFDPEDRDTFVAHVPTQNMQTGRLACTVTGSYQDEHVNSATGQHYRLPFKIGIVSNIDIVEPYV